MFAYWRQLAADSIAVVWTDGVRGVMLRLEVRGDTLRGVSSSFNDLPGDRPRPADVIATRVPCPAPDSSALLRAIDSTSAGLRELRLEMATFSMEVGDTIFARGEGVSGDGQAMRPNVVWASSDTTVISVDAMGLVRARASGSATLMVITRDARAIRRLIVTPRTFRAMAVGAYRACGLAAAGPLFCWGAESAERPVTRLPARLRAPRGLTSLTAGFSHFCGLDDLGRAYCWGDNEYGELGTGNFLKSETPAQVAGGLTFMELSAGSHFTCGVTRDGAAYCWGLNDAGELGAGGEPAGSCGRAEAACGNLPVRVASSVRFRTISASYGNACAISASGDVYCWGRALAAREPKRITADARYTTVSSGGDNGCAVAGDGRAYCWGTNQFGQLGDGTRRASTRPVPVAGAMRFEGIITSGTGTCALTITGKAYCWGLDSHGSLGLVGAAPDSCAVAERGVLPCATRPVAMDGGQLYAQLVRSMGSGTCGLTLSGVAYCWGTSTPVAANLHACVSTSGPLPVTGAPVDPRTPRE